MNHIRVLNVTAGLTLAVLGAYAALTAEKAAAQPEAILVYNAQHASLTRAWAEGFTRDTGTKVTIRNGGDAELANQIVQEASLSPADVFFYREFPSHDPG
jgi:iron(III) transport system substrate-binding protein